MQEFILAKQHEIAELCRKHHVRRLAVFGSAARDDFDPSRSDVDLRIEFERDSIERYADNYFELQDALEALFQRKVDILSSPTIRNPYFRDAVESSQVTIYAG
jgi:predicted nucleotidyltransferase